jgi:CubicO group peptidase (beta-lactamase class C family)
MKTKTFTKGLLSLLMIFSIMPAALPQIGYAQTAPAAAAVEIDQPKALQAIEDKVEARRKELGIPGVSLVIVKDDQIIYIKGLGFKDFENKVPVTPDTQFAIGSATKAFTALTALMSIDEGKLSLDDAPKKYLPYFKMYDPETDQNIKIRNLMSHSSGLNRTDLAMVTGKLNRAELIQVAGQAKPTAKLGEKFQYQNIMFAAVGEIVAQVQHKPWEKFVPERIFQPLHMTNSNLSIKAMQKSRDYSFGYDYNSDTKETQKLPFRDIDQVGPAGSINSSARDMAEWLRFVLNGGTADGKRLVSEKGYEEWLKPQMKIAGSMSYGFGWFLQQWNGMKVVQHGGNIDGFNSLVAMIPEKKLGFVLLTNVSASSLGGDLMPVVWKNLLGEPQAAEGEKLPIKTMEKMVGKYSLASANMEIEVKIDGEKLMMIVPGQPAYTLVRTAPRQFHPAELPDGFSVKFTPEQGDAAEVELQQPGHTTKFTRVRSAAPTAPLGTSGPDSANELLGSYLGPSGKKTIDIRESSGKVTFNIPGQPPYALVEKAKDTYAMDPLPETYWLKARRDAAGKIEAVVVTQPEGEFAFTRTEAGADTKPTITVDELAAKTVDAIGGEANWLKIKSRLIDADIDFESQGVKGTSRTYSVAPNKSATESTFTALGKTIGTEWDYFDGTNGADLVSFAPLEKYTGKRLDDVRLAADLYSPLHWRTNYKKVNITGVEKVGNEDAYAVLFEPNEGTNFTEYYSTTSFLLLKRTGVVTSSTSAQQLPYSIVYSDYRIVDGIKLPFKMVNSNIANGEILTMIRSVKHNVPIDEKLFAPRKATGQKRDR